MKTKYELYKKTTEYSDYTKCVYYNVKQNVSEKKFKPVTFETGERVRQNVETGEYSYYTLADRQNSVRQSIRRTQDQVFALCDCNDFEWFVTLTFDSEKIDRTDPEKTVACYEKWIMSLQHKCPDMKYLTVPELHQYSYGGKCLHFHILMKDIPIKLLGLTNSHKVCCSWATRDNGYTHANGYCSEEHFNKSKEKYLLKFPDGTEQLPKPTDGLPVYNVSSFIYGLTTATKIADKARTASYVRTYVEKGFTSMADTLFVKRYYYSHNLKLPDNWKELISETDKPTDVIDYAKVHDDYVKSFKEEGVSYVHNKTYNCLTVRVPKELKEDVESAKNKGLRLISKYEEKELKLDELFEGEYNDKKDT